MRIIIIMNVIICSSNMKDDPDNYSTKRSNVHRALIFQGGGSLGAHMKQEHTKPSARNYQFFLESNKIEKEKKKNR